VAGASEGDVLNLGVGQIPVDFAGDILTMQQKPSAFGLVAMGWRAFWGHRQSGSAGVRA
jgi:hypothetical protein